MSQTKLEYFVYNICLILEQYFAGLMKFKQHAGLGVAPTAFVVGCSENALSFWLATVGDA